MNILVVHEVEWSSKVVFEVHEIPELLARRGHRVVFIDYEESYKRAGCFDVARVRTKVRPRAHRLYADGDIEVRTPGLVKLPGLDRATSLFTQYAEIRRTIARAAIDVVFLYAMPTSGLSTLLAARRADVPVVFRAIDVLHKLRPHPMADGIWAAERLGMRRVDWVLALTPRLAEYAIRMGTPRDRVSVMRPGMAPEFRPAPKDPEIMARWGISPLDRVAMFLGIMYEFSGIDYVIQHFPQVVQAVPGTMLLLVGGANELESFRTTAAASDVAERIVFTGMQPFQELPGLINLADLAFNSFQRSKLTDAVFPGKLPQYMACGKPLLSTPLSATRELLEGEHNGVVFRELGPGFMQAMAELLGDEERRLMLGAAARRFVEQECNWERTIDQLESVFEQVVEARRGGSDRLSQIR